METANEKSPASWVLLTLAVGMVCYATVLATFGLADGDLWAKLALGAQVWIRGEIPAYDQFAFTPTLAEYIDHEWGSGTIFFGILQGLGGGGLMMLKIILALGALLSAMTVARRLQVGWGTVLALAIPAAVCLLPGYIPVIRSHAFTYCLFGLTLLCLEVIRQGRRWAAWILPPMMALWINLHGGCVAGLGAVGVYTAWACYRREHAGVMLGTALACGLATLANPQGWKFWTVLLPAILHPRSRISEWQPLTLWDNDPYIGFRLLFAGVLVLVAVGWTRTEKKSWPGLVMLLLTAVLGWRTRRHAPFFAVTALAFAGPFLATALARISESWSIQVRSKAAVAGLYGSVTLVVVLVFLPRASFQVLAPVGQDPVREMDILSLAQAEGTMATPFRWGSYCSWRLFPRVKVSMDGRYEAVYPESTFQMNMDFYDRRGPDWDRLVRDHDVDYVLLELKTYALRPEDLSDKGYVVIWMDPENSALLAKQEHVALLGPVAANLPPTTIDPLDPDIPRAWWTSPADSRKLAEKTMGKLSQADLADREMIRALSGKP